MDNKKKLRKLGCVLIGFLIAMLAIYKKNVNLVYYSIIAFSLEFIVIIAYKICKVLKPNWLLSAGRYNEAIAGFKKIIKKYENKVKVRNVSLFNIALCYSRMGEFEKSDDYLKQIHIDEMSEYLKWDYFILNTMNIMLLGEEVSEAEPYLQKALSILKKEEFYPAEAYFNALQENNSECLNYIYRYLEFIEGKKILFNFVRSSIIVDKFIYNIQNNFFIGVCYLKMNNWVIAKQYLKKACKCNYDNYFSRKSKELLEAIK